MHGKFGLNFNNSVGIGNAKGMNFGGMYEEAKFYCILIIEKPLNRSIKIYEKKSNDSLTKSRKKSL
jgi:hypothetical protein